MNQALEELPLTKKDIAVFAAQAQLHTGIVVTMDACHGRIR